MKKILYGIGVIIFLFLMADKCDRDYRKDKGITNESRDTNVNLDSDSDVINYLQGKWELKYYPSGGSHVKVRLLIEGNTIKTWSLYSSHSSDNKPRWNMNEPAEHIYNYTIGEKTDNGKRYVEWDDDGDLTLEQRAIGTMYVMDNGLFYGSTFWVVREGWSDDY